MTHQREKQIVGDKAVMLIQSGMKVGIGTGSTIEPFIQSLLQRIEKEQISIQCVATSQRSKNLLQGKIPLLNENLSDTLDISFDGADLFDPKHFISIKGGGGALLREKLVALSSQINVVLIDASKLSTPLKNCKVAIEVIPFGVQALIKKLQSLGYTGRIRGNPPTLTDNQNYIFDLEYPGIIFDPISEHFKLKQISGVVETGFFFKYAKYAYVGYPDGNVQILEH